MIEVAYTQHSGKRHQSQQDALWNGVACMQKSNLITSTCIVAQNRWLLAVADGVAISPFPHLASRFVIRTLADLVSEADLSSKLVRAIHGKLCDRYAKGRTLGSSTTLVAVLGNTDACQVLNVGDSRAYLIPANGNWKQLSRDHTILNDLIETGQADAETEYAQIYDGLACSLTADDEEDSFDIHQTNVPLLSSDRLLLCSDGVHDTLGNTQLAHLYNAALCIREQVEIWRKAVLAAGAPDNFSIILARRVPAPPQSPPKH